MTAGRPFQYSSLSTIRNADLIFVLDQGTIIERGTHAELLSKQGFYVNLTQSQLATVEIKAGEHALFR
jgi:ABC-type transport system involved in cytochrome bd biosynthesis fused ATPase/permease subunit